MAVAAADLSYPLAFVCRGADLSAEAESHAAEHKCHINCFKLLSSTPPAVALQIFAIIFKWQDYDAFTPDRKEGERYWH